MSKLVSMGILSVVLLVSIFTFIVPVNAANTNGFDQWGYNQKALIFNGWYVNNYAGRGDFTTPYVGVKGDPCGNIATYFTSTTCDPMTGSPSGPYWYAYNVWVVMNWNKAWEDGNRLETWTANAWITNHQTGWYLGDDGKVHQWEYFVKIVWIGGGGSTSPYWRPGGYVIWTNFEAIQEVYNDPYGGYNGILTHAIPSGFGTG